MVARDGAEADGALMESGGIQSIEVGMRLMRAFLEAGKPVTLKSLADAAGFAPPKAHRYLVSLVRSGLVEREPQTGRYSIGPLAIELGFAALGRIDQEGLGRKAISDLSEVTGMTCCLTVWTGEAVIVSAVAVGLDPIFTSVRTGTRSSFTGSASGRLFLAYLPAEQTRESLNEELRRTGFSQDALRSSLAQIREERVAIARDSISFGVSALAAPVFDHNGQIVYTLTLLGPSATFDSRLDSPVARAAFDAAYRLSVRLGFQGERPGSGSGVMTRALRGPRQRKPVDPPRSRAE